MARLARAGRPVIAECAGLLYLARELDGQPMCGVLDATAGDDRPAHPRLPGRGRRGRLGAWRRPGRPCAATSSTAPPSIRRTPRTPAWTVGDRPEGFVQRIVHASYLHLHWAGYPQLARRVVEAAAA